HTNTNSSPFFLTTAPSTTHIYTLSLHDALPISLHGKLIFFRRATPAATRPCRKTEFANPGKHSGKLANSSVDSRQIESSGHDRGPCVLAKYFAGGLRRVFNLCRAGWLRARHPLTGRSRPFLCFPA